MVLLVPALAKVNRLECWSAGEEANVKKTNVIHVKSLEGGERGVLIVRSEAK